MTPDEEDRYIAVRAAENNGWPFGDDATQDDPLTAHRIAVTHSHPSWRYIVAFDRESPARPTEAETRMLASFLDDYKAYFYNQSYLARLAARPLDVDGSANTVIFHKFSENDWGYRRASHETGTQWTVEWPDLREKLSIQYPGARLARPFTLAELMDFIREHGADKPSPRWEAWKAAHPEAFPPGNGEPT